MRNYNFNDTYVQWNMAQAFLMRLDNKLNEFQNEYHNGNLKGCYLLLKSIIGTVAFKLENIQDHEEKLNEIKIRLRNIQVKISQQSFLSNVEIIEDLIYNLYKKLNYDLSEAGLIFKKKEEYDILKRVNENYE